MPAEWGVARFSAVTPTQTSSILDAVSPLFPALTVTTACCQQHALLPLPRLAEVCSADLKHCALHYFHMLNEQAGANLTQSEIQLIVGLIGLQTTGCDRFPSTDIAHLSGAPATDIAVFFATNKVAFGGHAHAHGPPGANKFGIGSYMPFDEGTPLGTQLAQNAKAAELVGTNGWICFIIPAGNVTDSTPLPPTYTNPSGVNHWADALNDAQVHLAIMATTPWRAGGIRLSSRRHPAAWSINER